MSILKVAMMGHPVLRTPAEPVPQNEIKSSRIQQLIDDMFETMREYSGIGLAGPQVHQGLRIFVAGTTKAPVPNAMTDDHDMPYIALVNPEIEVVSPQRIEGWEGCLSIPEVRGLVPRAMEIRVRALDRAGRRLEFTASGLPARVIQHEHDHLDGVLFMDRMPTLASLTYMDEYRRFWAKDDDDHDEDGSGE
ncbi:MAG: peptide deformylase [Vicinamibacterales bacterium]